MDPIWANTNITEHLIVKASLKKNTIKKNPTLKPYLLSQVVFIQDNSPMPILTP